MRDIKPLIEYVQQKREVEVPDELIRNDLLQDGAWSEEEIVSALEFNHSKPTSSSVQDDSRVGWGRKVLIIVIILLLISLITFFVIRMTNISNDTALNEEPKQQLPVEDQSTNLSANSESKPDSAVDALITEYNDLILEAFGDPPVPVSFSEDNQPTPEQEVLFERLSDLNEEIGTYDVDVVSAVLFLSSPSHEILVKINDFEINYGPEEGSLNRRLFDKDSVHKSQIVAPGNTPPFALQSGENYIEITYKTVSEEDLSEVESVDVVIQAYGSIDNRLVSFSTKESEGKVSGVFKLESEKPEEVVTVILE